MAREIKPDTHGPWYKCNGEHEAYGCMNCVGGLSYCMTCGAFEGATPDECPGKPMGIFSDLVYKGIVNFRDGNWYGECCKAMRHVYDLDGHMYDAGYFQNEHGRWEKFPNA